MLLGPCPEVWSAYGCVTSNFSVCRHVTPPSGKHYEFYIEIPQKMSVCVPEAFTVPYKRRDMLELARYACAHKTGLYMGTAVLRYFPSNCSSARVSSCMHDAGELSRGAPRGPHLVPNRSTPATPASDAVPGGHGCAFSIPHRRPAMVRQRVHEAGAEAQ